MLTIRPNIRRAPASVVQSFQGVPSCYVVDAMARTGALDARIHAIVCDGSFAGPALPVAAGLRDVLAPYAALKVAQPGDILVIATDGYTNSAVLGGVMAGLMRNAGIAAVVTDGMVRDLPSLESIGMPIFAQGLTPNSPLKRGPGSVGLPIVIGGRKIEAGDIVVGDQDGVAVVPADRIEEVLAALPAIRQRDADLEAMVASGTVVPSWLEEVLAGKDVEYVD